MYQLLWCRVLALEFKAEIAVFDIEGEMDFDKYMDTGNILHKSK